MRNILVQGLIFLLILFVRDCLSENIKKEEDKAEVSESDFIDIFYLDENHRPVVDLQPLEPLSEGVKAILAMYALQAGGGCGGSSGAGLECKLTSSLGLGEQCSDRHISLVRSWFKHNMPSIGRYAKGAIKGSIETGNFRSICYNAPDTATRQKIWISIRVKRHDDVFSVEAESEWISGADGPSGKILYETEYQIELDEIILQSHLVIPGDQEADSEIATGGVKGIVKMDSNNVSKGKKEKENWTLYGSYSVPFQADCRKAGNQPSRCGVSNILEIKELSGNSANISIGIIGGNLHQCQLEGVAHKKGDYLEYHEKYTDSLGKERECILHLKVEGRNIVLYDQLDRNCKRLYCGQRAGFAGKKFPISD